MRFVRDGRFDKSPLQVGAPYHGARTPNHGEGADVTASGGTSRDWKRDGRRARRDARPVTGAPAEALALRKESLHSTRRQAVFQPTTIPGAMRALYLSAMEIASAEGGVLTRGALIRRSWASLHARRAEPAKVPELWCALFIIIIICRFSRQIGFQKGLE